MQIFDFCKPSYALDKTDKYLSTTGLYLLKKMEPVIPKSCYSLYSQLLDQKEKIFFNHPRAWHFVYTTKNLISDFSNDRLFSNINRVSEIDKSALSKSLLTI